MKLRYHDRSNRVQSMMKTRKDNNAIDHISVVSAETETKISRPI